jgi:hypothetical protein
MCTLPQNHSQKERFYVNDFTLRILYGVKYLDPCTERASCNAYRLFWKHPVLTPGIWEGRRRTRGCNSTMDLGLRFPLARPTVICFRNNAFLRLPIGCLLFSPVDFCHTPRSQGFKTRLSSRRRVPGYNTTRTQIEETEYLIFSNNTKVETNNNNTMGHPYSGPCPAVV